MAEKPEGYGETPESHATAQQVLTDFYDEFLKKMDANAVSMLLQAKEIISDGDLKTIQGHASLKQQNLILHGVLMKKCTDEAFKLACDVIIKADPTNAVMIELAENMKRRLEPHTGSHTGPIERLPDLHRKRPRSSSQSSEELVLQPYKRHHDYLDLKMDLLACDMSDLQGESDSNVIIRLLYSNTLRTIIKLLEPHLTDVKMEANRYCQLDLHHVKVTEEIIDSSASVQRLLNQMSVTGKWDNTRFLRKAVAAIPCSALEREVAEVVLSHYNLHLVYYERATLLKESLQSGNQEMSTDKNTNLVPLEITIPKAFNDVTREDCHRLQVCVLSTAYDIPEENITYYGAEERHSTTIIYLIPRQYISEIMQRNTQLETVWVLLELDVIEVAIPEVFLFKPSVDHCLNLLKNSRAFKVDLLGMTEVLPYQMYALLDSNVDPLMRFDRPKSGNTAGCVSQPSMDSTDLEIVFKGSGPSTFLDFESPGTPSPVATISPSVKEKPLSTTYQSKAAPAVPECGAHESRASERHRDTPESNNFAKQILGEFRERFIDDVDANTVAHELHDKGIIPDGVRDNIVQNRSQQQRNAILHDCLQSTSTSESLRIVCDVAIKFGKQGHPRMMALGEAMKRRLQEAFIQTENRIARQRQASSRKRRKPSDPSIVEETEDSQLPKAEALDLRHFWPYQCLHHVQARLPLLSTLIRIFHLFLVILQLLFSMLVFAFSVYHSATHHSCITMEKWSCMFVTVLLYFFTRGLLPLITVWAFSSAVVSKLGTQTSSLGSDFLKAISREENEPVLQEVVRTFWDVGLAKKTYSTILRTLTQHLAKELGVMCVTSALEAAIITLMLVQVGATRIALDTYSIPLGGVLEVVIESLDALSYFALILTIGIICSFFNHEATMNRLVAGAVALEDDADSFSVQPSKELITSAKNTVNNFNNSWSFAESFLFLSVQLYTLILVFFAGAGLPLSCGVTAHMYTEKMHLYWFPFVIIFSVGHFLSTCVWPSAHGASEYRVIGILLEALLLVIVYIVQPPLFGSFLQILFVVMPAAYLFWYLWMKVHYENSVRSAKPREWRQPHERNMGIYICLMAQLIVAIILSIFSEYSIMQVKPVYVG